jgi:hypothetical protein
MEKLFTGWRLRVLEFCFFLYFWFLPNVPSAGKYSVGLLKVSQACLELVGGTSKDKCKRLLLSYIWFFETSYFINRSWEAVRGQCSISFSLSLCVQLDSDPSCYLVFSLALKITSLSPICKEIPDDL